MSGMGIVAAIGFFCVFLGNIVSALIAGFAKRLGARFEGCAAGFTAGIIIAFVCFKILEEGFLAAPLYIGLIGLLLGVFAAAYLDGVVSDLSKQNEKGAKASLLIALSVMLHNFPEGIALGAMCSVSLSSGLVFAAVTALHCIPEGIAVFMPLNNQKLRIEKTLFIAAVLALPMMLGGVAGVLLMGISGMFLAISLTFAAGIMLYVTCGEVLPESKNLWNGRLVTVCALMGFILGVVITV